jgi:hypothetical protein
MSTHGDTRRSIAAWLEDEAADRAPSRLIEASRARVRATPQRTGWWPAATASNQHGFAKLAVAAVVVMVASLAVVGLTQRSDPTVGPTGLSPSPTPLPSVAAPSGPVSGGVWPQSTAEEVREAQERADAGDPAYTWQVDQALDLLDRNPASSLTDVNVTVPAIVDRFLREVLGWDAFLFNVRESVRDDGDVNSMRGLEYIRCAPGERNPRYPTADERAPGAERCAPTIDDLRYESVRIDLEQPGWQGPDGIWVVSDWAMTAPFAQADPRVTESEVKAGLEEWLAARVAGVGAETNLDLEDERGDGRCGERWRTMCRIGEVPLLYATTSGAPYERYEIERVSQPTWPYAEMELKVRLFADDGATVVEQPISWVDTQPLDGQAGPELLGTVTEMTENDQPVAVPFVFLDGEVTASAARPWRVSHQMFNYGLSLHDNYSAERVTFVPDPLPVTTPCLVGSSPADAAALALCIGSDPDFETTAPVHVIVGGAQAVYMDITLAKDGVSSVVTSRSLAPHLYGGASWRVGVDEGSRARLYLVDLPEGSSTRMLAIAIAAPALRFEQVLEAAAPIVDSLEFQAR